MENSKDFKDIYNDKFRYSGWITKGNYDKLMEVRDNLKKEGKAYSKGATLDYILKDYFQK